MPRGGLALHGRTEGHGGVPSGHGVGWHEHSACLSAAPSGSLGRPTGRSWSMLGSGPRQVQQKLSRGATVADVASGKATGSRPCSWRGRSRTRGSSDSTTTTARSSVPASWRPSRASETSNSTCPRRRSASRDADVDPPRRHLGVLLLAHEVELGRPGYRRARRTRAPRGATPRCGWRRNRRLAERMDADAAAAQPLRVDARGGQYLLDQPPGGLPV